MARFQDRWATLVTAAQKRNTLLWLPPVLIAATSCLLFEPRLASISCVLGWTMYAIAVVDAQKFIVPDILSLPAIPAGLLVARMLDDGSAGQSPVLMNLGAAALGAAMLYAVKEIYRRWRGRDGLGLGDVKLAAVAGAWTGFAGLSHVLLLACLSAIGWVLVANMRDVRAIDGSTEIAFGVFLAPAIWLVWCASALMGATPSGIVM